LRLSQEKQEFEEKLKNQYDAELDFYKSQYEKFESECRKLEGQLKELPNQIEQIKEKEIKLKNLDEAIVVLNEERENKNKELNEKREELANLRGQLTQTKERLEFEAEKERLDEEKREKRETEAFAPIFEIPAKKPEANNDEWQWLKGIEKGIEDSGFKISQRLLKALPTSFKAQDISPLTLLSGISGTGKSELPRLYADFGGLFFLPIAVQPNWDSPMDLFGFFNFSDGYFRSTRLSQGMYQFVVENGEKSLKDYVLLVLLDEMNLARVEYYFSDLLSRLETRRSLLIAKDDSDEKKKRASIDLDIGKETISMYLDTNILFAGTLNEDESTLDISDKVIDRSNVLKFPRPKSFVDAIHEKKTYFPEGKLKKEVWQKWCNSDKKDDYEEEKQKLTQEFTTINKALGYVNRGVGQRVFQAVLRYLMLYPYSKGTFKAAIEDAKVDQYAMKILPKLQGVDLQSSQWEECKNTIAAVIPKELEADFNYSFENREIFDWQGASKMFE
jgi:hypothetical protein